MTKDSFQILADELTLIRHDIERLQRTSLNKDEANALHKIVTEKADDMLEMGPLVERAVERKLALSMVEVAENASRAAQEAAERAVTHSQGEAAKAAETLLQDAHRARRIALQHQGRFWVWIATAAAVCLLCGSLATMAIQGRADAMAFGTFTSLYCSSAGGHQVHRHRRKRLLRRASRLNRRSGWKRWSRHRPHLFSAKSRPCHER